MEVAFGAKMNELNKEKLDKIKEKLKPYWKDYQRILGDFFHETNKLQKKMNKELKLSMDLEFFYADGECVGIGAENYADRKKFPLIHDSDLD